MAPSPEPTVSAASMRSGEGRGRDSTGVSRAGSPGDGAGAAAAVAEFAEVAALGASGVVDGKLATRPGVDVARGGLEVSPDEHPRTSAAEPARRTVRAITSPAYPGPAVAEPRRLTRRVMVPTTGP